MRPRLLLAPLDLLVCLSTLVVLALLAAVALFTLLTAAVTLPLTERLERIFRRPFT